MRSRFSFLPACVAGILALGFSAAVPAQLGLEKAAERSQRSFDREQVTSERRELHRWLVSERVEAGRGNPLLAEATDFEKAEIDLARGEAPVRVGFTKALFADVSFADLQRTQLRGNRALQRGNGALQASPDGGWVYTSELESPDATALRVQFQNFRLPENAGLYLYAEDGQAFGPYTGRGLHGDGEFWSHTVMGERLTLQLRQFGPATDDDLKNTSFRISGLAHLRPRFLGGQCGQNESCVENIACAGTLSQTVQDAQLAVAHMQWVSGPYIYICSGGLLADTDESSEAPLFLSANHCISRNKDARSLENFFQLYSESCPTSCPGLFDHRADHPQNLRTLGARILATGRDADFTLFELQEPAPGGSFYLGWDAAPVAEITTALFRVSHPSGAPQAYSEHTVDPAALTCQSWPRGPRIYSRDTSGATEGGSSGSPVFDADGKVVGQLSGACGTNVNDVCDSASNATVDGALAAYIGQVLPFLDPDTGGGCVVTGEEICNDGLDNDCDGAVDGNDSDCDIGGGLLGSGESCSANSQCLSGNCKGKPGEKTCK